MKKAVSALLVLTLMLVSASPALAKAAPATPLIIVTGMNTLPLYKNIGTELETKVFPPQGDEITEAVKAVLLPTLKVLIDGDWDSLCDALAPAIRKLFEPVACVDGESKYSVKTIELADCCDNIDPELVSEAGRALAINAAKRYGSDRVYIFTYDWRLDLYETSAKLNSLVKKVQRECNSSKVDLAPISMGGAVTTSYLSRFGGKDIENITSISSAFNGVGIVGDLFTGKLEVGREAVIRYLCQLLSDSPPLVSTFTALTSLVSFFGAFNFIFDFADSLMTNTYDRMYSDVIKETFGSMPGIRELVPADEYEASMKFMFNKDSSGKLEETLDRYYSKVSNVARDIYLDAIDDGVKIAFLSNYGSQGVPVYEGMNGQHDSVIDTVLTSGGATCADIGKKLGRSYIQKNQSCGHSHISPDNVIDASTCFFPEYTWFIKNFGHVGFEEKGDSTQLFFTLSEAQEQANVFTFDEYPQFLYYSYTLHRMNNLTKFSPASKFVFN